MNEEDIKELLHWKVKEQAYNEGAFTGFLFGICLGSITTVFIAWFTANTWLPFLKNI